MFRRATITLGIGPHSSFIWCTSMCMLSWLVAGIQMAAKTTQQQLYGPLSRTTLVSQYQKKHSPTHHPDHHPIYISFFNLPRSIASSGAASTMPPSYIRVRAVLWAYGRGQTDTQTCMITIHFASSTTHAKRNEVFV